MKKKMIVALLPLLFLASSCSINPTDWITKTVDFSKLYIGGYPTISSKDDSSEIHDYFLYVSFENSSVSFKKEVTDYSYDVEINLNSGSLKSYGQKGDDGNPVFYDVGSYFSDSGSFFNYSSLKSYFAEGNYCTVFSSVGRLVKGNPSESPYVSSKARIGASGQMICVNTISAPDEQLTYSVSSVYKEEFVFGGK
ncbi:MAG: hypothetical protein WCR56_04310 [Bacilli bacterium]